MPALVDGLWLQQYVAPGLLVEFRNYNDEFIAALSPAPEAAVSTDGIRMNKLINNVGFLVNNTEVFNPTAMSGKKVIIPWDKLDTTPTKVDDAEIRGLAFDKRSEVRKKHTESFQIGVRDYVLNKLAPAANADGNMPVLRTTGADDGTGRNRLTFEDLIKFYGIIETLNLPNADKLNFVLDSLHKQDLMVDRASTNNYRDGIVIDPATGKLIRFYKLKIWENNASPVYAAAGTLKAQGAAPVNTDRKASTFFYGDNTVYRINSLKLLYKPETTDTRNPDPTSEFRIQTYGLCEKTQEYGFGALVSGIVS